MRCNITKKRIISMLCVLMMIASFIDVRLVQALENVLPNHLIINQVYGGGGKGDTPISHSFIEIYNPTDSSVSLEGWSIQYASNRKSGNPGTTENQWVMRELTGTIPAKTSFLIRGAKETSSVVLYEITDEMADLDWSEQYIDNDQYRIALANNTELLDEVNVFGKENVVDLLSVKEDGETTAVDSVSKQKSVRRKNFIDTDNNASDFEVLEYKESTEEFVNKYRPRSLKDGQWENEENSDNDGSTPTPPVDEEVFDKTPINDTISIEKIAGFFTGISSKDGGAAEIVKYNKDNNKFYAIDGIASKIHVVSLEKLTSEKDVDLKADKTIDVKDIVEVNGFVYGDITSITINTDRDEIAVAVQEEDYSKEGKIVVIDYEGNLKEVFTCGVQPDMITYSPDGKYILTANEGEPRNGFAGADPEGSITIVNIETKESVKVGFEGANIDSKVHIRTDNNGNKIDPKYDLEPEYIAIDNNSKIAYVSLQENNAIASIDIQSATVKSVKGLGYKDHSLEENALDAANNSKIQIETLPIKGLYMPDSITYYNGYIITANEGDATEWGSGNDAFENINSFGKIKGELESFDVNNFEGYTSQEELDAKLSEMKNSTKYDKLEVLTDVGNEAIYVLGGRSFSIWNAETLELVYDSGNDFETITAQRYEEYFNVSNNKVEKDARSTKKGPEPEEVKVGQVGDKTYAFVGIERIGGVMTYDITNLSDVKFANYINTRDFNTAMGGDVAPESIDFIPAEISPTMYPLLVVANEVSGTVSILQINHGQYVPEKENVDITIFHTNDTHGRVKGDSSIIGIDTISAIKNSVTNSLLVDAGDTVHGLPFATMNKGADIVELMKMAGYDLMVPGNHDFNYGYDRLLELAELAKSDEKGFEIISANTVKDNEAVLNANSIKEVDGVKVGFFGLSSPETAYKTNPNNIIGIEFADPITTAEAQVKSLKEAGADVVIALAHIGDDESTEIKSTDIAEKVNGIDLIIDGHSHSKYENGLQVGNTLIVSTGEYQANLGKVTVTVNPETKEVIGINASLINKEETSAYTADADVTAKIAEIDKAQEVILSQVVGSTVSDLDGERANVRTGETNLGNLVTDAMLNTTGAEIAITNGGGIRASIKAGDITKGDLIAVLPFGNFIVTKYLTGEQIKDVIEHGIKDAPNAAGQFPHVAGINYIYDPAQPAGSRIVKITFNGEPLEKDEKYLVATNDFISAGGDGYPHFNDIKTENEFSALDEALAEYVQKLGTVDYNVEGRIVTGTLEEEIEKEDIKAANKVIKEIDKLSETITLKDKKSVESVRKSYDALTNTQKTLVSNYNKLVAAEAKIAELEEAEATEKENQAAADVVIELIKKLPNKVTLNDKEAVVFARAAYNELTESQKALVTNLDKLVKAEATIVELEKTSIEEPGTEKPESEQLPQTGGYDGNMIFFMGLVLVVGGAMALKRRKVS